VKLGRDNTKLLFMKREITLKEEETRKHNQLTEEYLLASPRGRFEKKAGLFYDENREKETRGSKKLQRFKKNFMAKWGGQETKKARNKAAASRWPKKSHLQKRLGKRRTLPGSQRRKEQRKIKRTPTE